MSSTIKLGSGALIPSVGYGTWRGRTNTQADLTDSMVHALKCGYKLVDTAVLYQTEDQVGRALQAANVKREDIWISTKIWPTDYESSKFLKVFNESLDRLKTTYVDALFLHWPVFSPQFEGYPTMKEVWDVCEELYNQKKVKHLAISNFQPWHIKELMSIAKIKPEINQLELHPWLPQSEIVACCKEHGIVCQAYRPFGNLAKGATGSEAMINDSTLVKLAEKHNLTVCQLIISWLVSKGLPVVAKSATPSRIESNIKITALPQDTIAAIDGIQTRKRFCPTPFEDIDPFEVPKDRAH